MASLAPDPRWKIARGFPRFALQVRVQILALDEDAAAITGRMVDVGLGGFCAEFAQPLRMKQRLTVEFRMPLNAAPIRVKAIVKHSTGARYGFQFLTITAEQREIIRASSQGLPRV